MDAIEELKNVDFKLREQEIAYIFTLIGNNRDYLEEQKTLKDVLYALADLIDNDYQSDDNNNHLIIKS